MIMNDVQKKMQKMTGIKQGQFDSDKERLYNACKTILYVTKKVINEIELAGMTNEQFFIDFEDELNELSIKDHNADQIS